MLSSGTFSGGSLEALSGSRLSLAVLQKPQEKSFYEKPEEKLVESILALSGSVRHFLALCGTFWLFVALLGSLAVWQKPQEKV